MVKNLAEDFHRGSTANIKPALRNQRVQATLPYLFFQVPLFPSLRVVLLSVTVSPPAHRTQLGREVGPWPIYKDKRHQSMSVTDRLWQDLVDRGIHDGAAVVPVQRPRQEFGGSKSRIKKLNNGFFFFEMAFPRTYLSTLPTGRTRHGGRSSR